MQRNHNGNMEGSSNQVLQRSNKTALSMALTTVATLFQLVHQGKGGSPHTLSISAIVVSLVSCLGYDFFDRTSISAARICGSLGPFSATLAIASLLALPLPRALKFMVYAVCIFPFLSLLSVLKSLYGDYCAGREMSNSDGLVTSHLDDAENQMLPTSSSMPTVDADEVSVIPSTRTISLEMAPQLQEQESVIDIDSTSASPHHNHQLSTVGNDECV